MDEFARKGSVNLKQEVIQAGWCVSCGLCADMCPYIKTVEDRIAIVHECNADEGNCYKVCPRTATDYSFLHRQIRDSDDYDYILGGYRKIYMARAINNSHHESGQYGGVVTALTAMSLREGLVDSSLLTANSVEDSRPEYVIAMDEENVIRAAGSKYVVYPTVRGLYQREMSQKDKTLVVGRPCQVTGLRKMQHYTSVAQGKKVEFIIGLFCFWGLEYAFYNYLEDELGIHSITSIDIPKNRGAIIKTSSEVHEVPLEKVRTFIRRGCHSCFDPTSELADVSVGSTESETSWCTLISRTEKGNELVNKAISLGVIEVRSYSSELEEQLREAVRNKKARVLLEKHETVSVNRSYLRINDSLQEKLKGGSVS
ncbi:MAG: Coenzyme F420 hydrogenase/dehydrogenase, beta subunit C-terminal domain [Dethiobacter sp.]|nr:Coenzyme F420 hydrogenase/dehydrogenase, beta subunit C-terminal domain [Dethiobacter sp.]